MSAKRPSIVDCMELCARTANAIKASPFPIYTALDLATVTTDELKLVRGIGQASMMEFLSERYRLLTDAAFISSLPMELIGPLTHGRHIPFAKGNG